MFKGISKSTLQQDRIAQESNNNDLISIKCIKPSNIINIQDKKAAKI